MAKGIELDEALVVLTKYAHDYVWQEAKAGRISAQDYNRTMDAIHVANLFLELIEGDYAETQIETDVRASLRTADLDRRDHGE